MRKQSKELSKFSLTNFSLTPTGSVNFAFVMTFNPNYLLYENNLKSIVTPSNEIGEDIVDAPIDTKGIVDELVSIDAIGDDVTTTTDIASQSDIETNNIATTSESVAPDGKPSVLRALWIKFKFW